MEETFQIKAINLKRNPFREYDSKIVVYSQEKGKLELIARGTKKISSKLSGHIEPINESDIMVVRGKQFDYAGSAVCRNSYINIKTDFEKIQTTGQIFKIVIELVKFEYIDKDIYSLLKEYLETVNDKKNINLNIVKNYFILKLLLILGYKPELFRCIKCQKKISPTGNKFDYSRGGIICKNCPKGKNNLTINENSIKLLRLIINHKLEHILNIKIDKKTSQQIDTIISSFYNYLHN